MRGQTEKVGFQTDYSFLRECVILMLSAMEVWVDGSKKGQKLLLGFVCWLWGFFLIFGLVFGFLKILFCFFLMSYC